MLSGKGTYFKTRAEGKDRPGARKLLLFIWKYFSNISLPSPYPHSIFQL